MPDIFIGNFKGPKGDTGSRGEKGEQGLRGLQGPKGDTGAAGPKGDTGTQGLRGPAGPKGDTGAQGSIGPRGPQGVQGPKGDTGPKGDKGDSVAFDTIGENFVNLDPGAWEDGSFWSSGTYDNSTSAKENRIRTKPGIISKLITGEEYTFTNTSTIDMLEWMVIIGNPDEPSETTYLKPGETLTLTAAGSELKLSAVESTIPLTLADLGRGLTIKVEVGSEKTPSTPKSNGEIVLTVDSIVHGNYNKAGQVIKTMGFFSPGDGGEATYMVEAESEGNFPETIDLQSGLFANMVPTDSVSYKMFGTIGDGDNDDGVQMRRAHVFANKHKIPLIARTGVYHVKKTNQIPIRTDVDWGTSEIHIDESQRQSTHTFYVRPTKGSVAMPQSEQDALKGQIIKGGHSIPGLDKYSDSFMMVRNANKQVMSRRASTTVFTQRDFFYINERGRIEGDIEETFDDITHVSILACDETYLTIRGGVMIMSGTGSIADQTYLGSGIRIERSRTIVRDQVVKLPYGIRDHSTNGYHGAYYFNQVYDVKLENVRVFPREKARKEGDILPPVPQGSYGLGGTYCIKLQLNNVTADSDDVAWGVFGTNFIKDLKIRDSVLNRVDVHYRGNNISICDSIIGRSGVTVTGGGFLKVIDSKIRSNRVVHLRDDYGCHWDGEIVVDGCTVEPDDPDKELTIVGFNLVNYDYLTDVVLGREIRISNTVVDYSRYPDNNSAVTCIYYRDTQSPGGRKASLPKNMTLENIRVRGRQRGLNLIDVSNPTHYYMDTEYKLETRDIKTNATVLIRDCDVYSPEYTNRDHGSTRHINISQRGDQTASHLFGWAPHIVVERVDGIGVFVGAAPTRVTVRDSEVRQSFFYDVTSSYSTVTFINCQLYASFTGSGNRPFSFPTVREVTFTNCIFNLPIIDGVMTSSGNAYGTNVLHPANGEIKGYYTGCRLSQDSISLLSDENLPHLEVFQDALFSGRFRTVATFS